MNHPPLMDEAEPHTAVRARTSTPCTEVTEELIRLFEDETARDEPIRVAVVKAKQLARTCHSAELNLAIAASIEILSPAHALNQFYAASFHRDAQRCDGYSVQLELHYLELRLVALRKRAGRNSAAMDYKMQARYCLAVQSAERELEQRCPTSPLLDTSRERAAAI
jgi:hypothetical protein